MAMKKTRDTHGKARVKPSRALSGLLTNTLIVIFAVIAAVVAAVALTVVRRHERDLSNLRHERDTLLSDMAETQARYAPGTGHGQSAFDAGMQEINPDYISWLSIEGTQVDHPVVRGDDNETYLSMSFSGQENRYGALFMDYRCIGDYVPHIIIYGHNSSSGDMFGNLSRFLDAEYLSNHPQIALKANDRTVRYEIFSVRSTDVNDPAFYIDFSAPGSFQAFLERCGAPPDAVQVITLSTCVTSPDNDDRLVIQGVLR